MTDRIICIAGPTASGKTALAVEIAKLTDGEVVNCDSMQIYKYMDIGTAKPTEAEKQGIVHHMIDVAEPDEDFSVSRYCAMAAPIVEDIVKRGKTAIIAGGTGLYMDSLIQGNDFAPFPSTGVRERLEQEAEAQGIQVLFDRLKSIDPEAAGKLHLSDRKRIIRALEVYLETGETITEHNRKTQLIPPRYTPIWLGLDFENRADLYERIDRRVGLMLEMGLIDEIQGLLAAGIPEKCTALQAIGYKEFVAALNGECTVELGFVLSDLLTNMERVSDHCSNIAVCVIQHKKAEVDAHVYLNSIKVSGQKEFVDRFNFYREKYSLPEVKNA